MAEQLDLQTDDWKEPYGGPGGTPRTIPSETRSGQTGEKDTKDQEAGLREIEDRSFPPDAGLPDDRAELGAEETIALERELEP